MNPIDDLVKGANKPDSNRSIVVKLTISYFGTAYWGWQSQPHGRTVQDNFEKALQTFLGHPQRVTSSSRTDTGVHAEHQVISFKSNKDLDMHKLLRGLNALLPLDIRVRHAEIVADDFHPTFSATGKLYRYRIWRSNGESPFFMPFSWHIVRNLNIKLMKDAAKMFCGVHDFTSFCAMDSSAKSKIRNLHEIKIIENGPLLDIYFLGEGFLKQMVRTITGTLVSVGTGRISIEEIDKIFMAKDRKSAPSTAPAQGLSLVQVFYEKTSDIESLLNQKDQMYSIPLWGEWAENYQEIKS